MRTFSSLVAGALLTIVSACSTSAQPAKQMSPQEVVATVGSTAVTLGEVDEKALQQPAANFGGARLVQALYLARRSALDEIIGNKLMDQEAKSRGIDRAVLVEQEIANKAATPTDADVEFWYQTNPAAVQGRTLDQLRAPIRSMLIEVRMSEAREKFLTTLKSKTPVRITLEAPRQQVAAAGHPARGSASAPIEMIEFSDFQCPFCQRANPTVDQILKTYGDKIHFVYRHFPLPNHPNARPAAEAAACAEEQGKFWEYHDRLFANSSSLTDADLKSHAAAVGVDAAKFNACFDSHKFKDAIDKDMREADAAGVTGTPAFFINGRSLEGAQPYEVFKNLIDEELELKKK